MIQGPAKAETLAWRRDPISLKAPIDMSVKSCQALQNPEAEDLLYNLLRLASFRHNAILGQLIIR